MSPIQKNQSPILLCLVCALSVLMCSLAPTVAHAEPVAPVETVLNQPDGSMFGARAWGDEHLSGFETLDGYTVIQDTPTKRWFYADRGTDGSLRMAGDSGHELLVGRDNPRGLSLHLRPARTITRRSQPQSLLRATYSAPLKMTGVQRTVVILAYFQDFEPVSTTPTDWSRLFFGSGSSVRSYYLEVSYSQLDLQPAREVFGVVNDGVVGWLRLPMNHPRGVDSAERQAVLAALRAADSYVDYSTFDTNGDGTITPDELHIAVVFAGYARSYDSTLSPLVSNVSWQSSAAPLTLDGKATGARYFQIGEMHGDHQSTLSSPCHEMGHDLGLPDLYDTDYSSEGVGKWSLMGSGNWNRTGVFEGDSPAHPDAWSKSYLGWLVPTRITSNASAISIPYAEANPTVYQLLDNPGGIDWADLAHSGRGEYFLLENRQKIGFDAGLPGSGMLIWHIDESVSSDTDVNSDEYHRLVDLEQADGLNSLNVSRSSYLSNQGSAGDPYPGTFANRTFNSTSNPSSRLYGGADSGVSVSSISNSGSTMTFAASVAPPITVGVGTVDGSVRMAGDGRGIASNDSSWTVSITTGTLSSTIDGSSYTLSGLPPGLAASAVKSGSSLVFTVAGTATSTVTSETAVNLIVKGSAVTEAGALDASPVVLRIYPPLTEAWVSPTGNDGNPGSQALPLASMNTGASLLASGGVLHVGAGTFNVTQVSINRPLSVVGAGSSQTIIDGGDSSALPVAGTIRVATEGNVSLSGVTIRRPGKVAGYAAAGVYCTEQTGVLTITQCRFLGRSGTDTDDVGVALEGRKNLIIDTCVFEALRAGGSIAKPTGGASITTSVFQSLRAGGGVEPEAVTLMAYGGANVTALVKISGNTFSSYEGKAVRIDSNPSSTSDSGKFGNVEVANNTMSINLNAGAQRPYDIVFYNRATVPAQQAESGVRGAVISGNTIRGSSVSGSTGILLAGAHSGIVISNNRISDLYRGIVVDGLEGAFPAGLTVRSNWLGGNTDAALWCNPSASVIDARDNWWGSANGPTVASNEYNTGSQGASITSGVTFKPWWSTISGAPGSYTGNSFDSTAPALRVTGTASDPVIRMASDNRGVSTSDNSWTLSITAGTLKPTLGSANLSISGLPSGLTGVVASGVGNTMVITVSGSAAQPLVAAATVTVTVYGSAVTEVGALDSLPISLTVQPANDTSQKIPSNAIIFGSKAYDLSLLNDASLANEILSAFIANGNRFIYRTFSSDLVDPMGVSVVAATLPTIVYLDSNKSATTYRAGDGGIQASVLIVSITPSATVLGRFTLTTNTASNLTDVAAAITSLGLQWTTGADAMTYIGMFQSAVANTDYALTIDVNRFRPSSGLQTRVRWDSAVTVTLANTASGIGKVASVGVRFYSTATQYRLLKADGSVLTGKVGIASTVVVVFLNVGDTCKVELYDAAGSLLDTRTTIAGS